MNNPLNVLLVEDSPDDAQLVILQLEQDGLDARYRRVDSEAEFITALDPPLRHGEREANRQGGAPDLILSDYSMPRFNGLRALQIVNERGLDIPFILISGAIGEEVAVEAMKQGADDYLMKDRLARLGASIQNALNQKRLRGEKARADASLRNSEARFRNIFQTAPVSIWEEDFTEVHAALEELRAQGVTDFHAYFKERPDFVQRAVQKVTVLDVNETTLRMYNVKDKTELLGNLEKYLAPDDFLEELTTFAEGKIYFERETVEHTSDGRLLNLWMTETFFMDEDGHHKALVCFNDITERKQAEAQVQRQLQRLEALHRIDMAIASGLDMNVSLGLLLDQTLSILNVDAAVILLLEPHTHLLRYAAGRGFRSNAIQHTNLAIGKGHAGRAALDRRTLHIPDLANNLDELSRSPSLANEKFKSYFAAPLIVKGHVKGALEIYHRSFLDPDQDWINFMETMANQAAIAIEDAQLFNELQRSNLELALAYDATIEGWSRALDLRDKETEGHTQRVTAMTLKLAQTLNIDQRDIIHMRRGALLHDIGKMGVPDAILFKQGELTKEEWEIMRRHPVYAREMILPIDYLKPALDIPYSHHEKWDGSGYPQGLKGEEIPLAARIFAVVDVWDALTSDRPYRAAWSKEKTREHLAAQSGKHFDPRVATAFLKMIAEE